MKTSSYIIFGGTFDPPHLGHLAIAEKLIQEFPHKKIIVIPAFDPPMNQDEVKKPTTSFEERVLLCEFNFNKLLQDGKLYINRVEEKLPIPSYMVDTILALKKDSPGEYSLAVGQDQFENFTNWKNYEKILEECSLIVFSRKLKKKNISSTVKNSGIKFFSDFDSSISSTEIRKALTKRKYFELSQMLHPRVLDYVHKNKLYLER